MGLTPHALDDMATRAVRFTTPGWNRKFHDYLFYIEDGVVQDVSKIDKTVEKRTLTTRKLKSDEILVYEECQVCAGAGCPKCVAGEVAVIRKLP